MKSLLKVKNDTGWKGETIQAVINGLNDRDQLRDVYEHGAQGGYGAFIYYSDTIKFAETHRADIVAHLKSMAEELGEDAVSFMASFNCLKKWDNPNDPADRRDLRDAIGFYLYSKEPEAAIHETNDLSMQVFNAAAWYALEEIARAFCED